MQAPVMVMNTNSKRESGRKAQLANIQAAKVQHFLRLPKETLLYLCAFNLGCRRYSYLDSWSPIHAKNAPRPDGRHRHDQ